MFACLRQLLCCFGHRDQQQAEISTGLGSKGAVAWDDLADVFVLLESAAKKGKKVGMKCRGYHWWPCEPDTAV